MKLNHLPSFEATLPIAKEVIKFRPFIMKEEKILLMASESGDTNAILEAIESCVKACTEDKVSCDTHSMVDVQYLFLQIRGKSVGEIIEYNLICGNCKTSADATLDINEVQVTFNENHKKEIKVDENLILKMRYPKLKHLAVLSDDNSTLDSIYDVVADCIESVEMGEEVYNYGNSTLKDFRELVDNLTSKQFESIRDFFDTMPSINHEVRFTCKKCEKLNVVKLDELVNFFV